MNSKEIINTLIRVPFFNLNIDKQAHVLTIFTQSRHDNPFIDELCSRYNTLFFHEEYNERFENTKYLLSKDNPYFLEKLTEFLSSINIPSEIYRLIAIIIGIKGETGDAKESDKALELSLQSLFKSGTGPLHYVFCVVKTRIDLLIYAGKYFEAADLCENTYNSLLDEISNEDAYWLKYQYSKTLIDLANHVNLTMNLSELKKQMVQFKEEAEFY